MSAGLLAVCDDVDTGSEFVDDVDTGSEFVSDTFDELESGTDELLLWVLVSDSAELVGVSETLIVGTLDEPVFSQPVSVSSIAAAAANAIAFVVFIKIPLVYICLLCTEAGKYNYEPIM